MNKLIFNQQKDHPNHSAHISDGLWSFYNDRNRKLARDVFEAILDVFLSRTKWSLNIDIFGDRLVNLLAEHIWPRVRNDSIIHDSYFCNEKSRIGSLMRPFPTQRDSFCFVGSSACCFNVSRVREMQVCPGDCRLTNDWIYC